MDVPDLRHKLNQIQQDKDEAYMGPKCHGPDVRKQSYPSKFCLPKHIQTYDGVAKPHTWLQDYANAVEIANGNSLVAVRYLPIMLTGIARAWIDTLPEKSINS